MQLKTNGKLQSCVAKFILQVGRFEVVGGGDFETIT